MTTGMPVIRVVAAVILDEIAWLDPANQDDIELAPLTRALMAAVAARSSVASRYDAGHCGSRTT